MVLPHRLIILLEVGRDVRAASNTHPLALSRKVTMYLFRKPIYNTEGDSLYRLLFRVPLIP